MAAMWVSWDDIVLGITWTIEEAVQAIWDQLPDLGYTPGATPGKTSTSGFNGQFEVVILFLSISGDHYWQVVAAGGSGSGGQAQSDVEAIKEMIISLGLAA